MSSSRRRSRAQYSAVGWLPFACVLAAILLLASSAISWVTSPSWGHHDIIAAPRNVGTVPGDVLTVPVSPVAAVTVVSPNRVVIPKLKVDAPVIDVSTLPGGELDVPQDPRVVGWWDGGPKPGAAKGTTILDGHINFSGVQGALGRIGTLDPGDLVYVDGMDNGKKTRLAFKITGVRTYMKKTLPYKEIFNQNVPGRLVLVTCGGPFDASTGNYLDNIVAYAVLA
jgi:hypothetical protein